MIPNILAVAVGEKDTVVHLKSAASVSAPGVRPYIKGLNSD